VNYDRVAIPDSAVPAVSSAAFEHAIETYVGETNKVASVWACFADEDLDWRPHAKASTVGEILRHQLLSERRFFGEFLSCPEPPPDSVLPAEWNVTSASHRLVQLARRRLPFLASQPEQWWLERVPFFDVERQRIWIFWRRVLHTAHHRSQLTVYLRLLDRAVPSTYGPTADVTWTGADPTNSVDAAGHK
jgi:uncharacterized damage-inducible protein DinB